MAPDTPIPCGEQAPTPREPAPTEPPRRDSLPADEALPADAARLADIDDRLAGHRPPGEGEAGGEDSPEPDLPAGLDAILLLRQMAAEQAGNAGADQGAMPLRIGRFAVVREVGRGGFARVYEALDTRLQRGVALKVARPEAVLPAGARRRFLREAELAARLDHPHVVTIHEAGEADGCLFIAEEFCTGGSLADWLDSRPGALEPRTAARVVHALAASHAFGIVHRDIKPANVLLVADPDGVLEEPGAAPGGGRWKVKLGDFGLGKLLADEAKRANVTDLTRSGTRVGTPAWMAPEQVDHAIGPVGAATDIHSLGLLLDRLLTGRCCQAGASEAETLRLVLFAEPVAADRIVTGVPADLAAVGLRCRAKRPSERYATAADLVADLRRFLAGQPTLVRPLGVATRVWRAARRRPGIAVATSVAVAAIVVAGGMVVVQQRQQTLLDSRAAEIRGHQAAATLRRGFEAWAGGDAAGALRQLDDCRSLDPALAGSVAGRWLLARCNGELDRLPAGSAPLHKVVVAPDGRTVAAGAADGRLHVWRLDDHGAVDGPPVVTRPHDEINDVALSPDGMRVASVGQDGRAAVSDTATGALVAERDFADGPLFGVGWAPDGMAVAVGGEGRTVWVWTPDGSSTPRALDPFAAAAGGNPGAEDAADPEIECLAYLDARRIVVACGRRVVVCDAVTGMVECELEGHAGKVTSVAASPDGTRLVTAGTDRQPRLWDLPSGTLVRSLPLHPVWVAGCRFSPDAARIATGCRDGVVRLFDAADGAPVTTFVGHPGRVWDVTFEPRGTILSAGNDGTLRRWDADSSRGLAGVHELPSPRGPLMGVAALGGGRFGVVGPLLPSPTGADEITTPSITLVGAGPGERISAESSSGRIATSGGTFEITTRLGAVTRPIPADVIGEAMLWTAPDELLIGARDGRLLRWHDDTGVLETLDDTGSGIAVHALAHGPGGRLAVATAKTVTLYETSDAGVPRRGTGRRLVELPPSTGSVTRVSVSPDGTRLAIGTHVGEVLCFDTATGLPVGTFARHTHGIRALEWSPEGLVLLSADADCVRFSDVRTTTVFDEIRPGATVGGACFGVAADGADLLVIVGARGGDNGWTGVVRFPQPAER